MPLTGLKSWVADEWTLSPIRFLIYEIDMEPTSWGPIYLALNGQKGLVSTAYGGGQPLAAALHTVLPTLCDSAGGETEAQESLELASGHPAHGT